METDFRVPLHVAQQPRPTRPNNYLYWRKEWEWYWQDLACWQAMKTDCLMFGVKEET